MFSPVLLAHALILLQLIRGLLDLGLECRHDVASGPGHFLKCWDFFCKFMRGWNVVS